LTFADSYLSLSALGHDPPYRHICISVGSYPILSDPIRSYPIQHTGGTGAAPAGGGKVHYYWRRTMISPHSPHSPYSSPSLLLDVLSLLFLPSSLLFSLPPLPPSPPLLRLASAAAARSEELLAGKVTGVQTMHYVYYTLRTLPYTLYPTHYTLRTTPTVPHAHTHYILGTALTVLHAHAHLHYTLHITHFTLHTAHYTLHTLYKVCCCRWRKRSCYP
jgi:hypothetical protein